MDNLNSKVPHVRQISLGMEALKQLICNRIGWNEIQYSEFQFEAGIQFIEGIASRLLVSDVKSLKASKLFWGWWRNQWFSRDIAAYDEILMTETTYREQNSKLHRSKALQASFWARVAAMIAEGEKTLKGKEKGDGI